MSIHLKHIWLFSLLGLLFPMVLGGQNLISNGSFEDTISCPTSGGQINKALYWFAPIGGGGSSELFHTCATFGYPSVPTSYFGYQWPRTGEAFAGICVFEEPYYEYGEYIETSLITGLNPKTTYYVEFYVSLASISKYAISNLGAHFTKTPLVHDSLRPFRFKPAIEYSGPPVTDSSGWTKISGYYIPPEDGISYLTIGNFRQSDSTNYQWVGYSIGASYYYIDDVLVMDSALVGVGLEPQAHKKPLHVYPNPAWSKLVIELPENYYSSGVILYDALGRIWLPSFEVMGSRIIIDLSELPAGMYFGTLEDDTNRRQVFRFIKSAAW